MDFDPTPVDDSTLSWPSLTPPQQQLVDTLFRQHYAPLCRYAASLGVEDDAEDVVSDTFLRLAAGHPCLADPDPNAVPKYLYTTVNGLILNRHRHAEVDHRYRHEHTEAVQAIVGPSPALTPDIMLEEAELQRSYEAACATLSTRQRQIHVLKRDGHTHAQIAELLGVSVPTITTQVRRTLQRLRHSLSGQLPELVSEDQADA